MIRVEDCPDIFLLCKLTDFPINNVLVNCLIKFGLVSQMSENV